MQDHKVTPDDIECWRVNYNLKDQTPADAMRWWSENMNGTAPAGAVAALGIALNEVERLRALLAEAERLCMEHCPGEMSEALRADWVEHQANAALCGGRSPSDGPGS